MVYNISIKHAKHDVAKTVANDNQVISFIRHPVTCHNVP